MPTITSGREDPRFEETVGPFFNFIPLRTDLSGCVTLRDVHARTRVTCIEAQTREIPFGDIAPEAPELMAPFADDTAAVGAIQVFQHPFVGGGHLDGEGLRYLEIRRRLRFQPVSGDIPDGLLWTFDMAPAEDTYAAVKFNRNEFDVSTVSAMVADFQEALRRLVADPDAPFLRDESLRQIKPEEAR